MSVDAIETPPPKTRTLKANFAINVAGALVPLAVSLVTVPIYIRHIGDARYGVLSIVWVLLGYFGFLDLGLSRAAANALARLRDAPQEARARVLVTTLVLNLGMGLIGSLVLALAGSYLLQHVLNVPEALKPEIASAFPWIVALFPLALVSGVGIGALESREEFLRANILQVVGTSLGQIVPVLLAVGVGPSLAVVIPAAVVCRALTSVAILVAVVRFESPLMFRHFSRTQVNGLIRYGGWVSISGVISPLLTSLDQFVIGSVLGVGAVAHYAIPMNLVLKSQILPGALSRTLFPRMSSVSSEEEANKLASRAFSLISFGYAAMCAPLIVLAPLLFSVWLGPVFSIQAAPVAEILLAGAWINGLAFVAYELLQSRGRPEVTGKFHALEVIPFVFILWAMTRTFGITGAASAWTLRCAIDAVCLIAASRIQRKQLVQTTWPLGIIISAYALSELQGRSSSANVIVVTALAVLIAAVFMAVTISSDVREAIAATLRPKRRGSASRAALIKMS